MKNQKVKIKKFILYFIFYICYLLFAISAIAQVQLETGLPNIPGDQLTVGQELPSYINYLFIFGLSLVAFLALAQMMLGGITYILAAGNAAKVEDAKETIKQALLGLGLLLVSYLLLRTINPDLVNLRNPNLTPTQFQDQMPSSVPPGAPSSVPSIEPSTMTSGSLGEPCIQSNKTFPVFRQPGFFLVCKKNDGQWIWTMQK